MSNLDEVLPEEAVNLEPLTRFKYRTVVCNPSDHAPGLDSWVVTCGHQRPAEYKGEGPTLELAIFNAGIDADSNAPVFTD